MAGRGRGRAANDPPPPLDYMAVMMQQFELNRQFMENVMAQFPQPNQHGHHHQHATVTLHYFTRSTPLCSATLFSRWMLMTGFATSLMSWSLLTSIQPTM